MGGGQGLVELEGEFCRKKVLKMDKLERRGGGRGIFGGIFEDYSDENC